MRIDPAKAELTKTLALLSTLSALTPARAGDPNDWAAKTAASLKSGKLETFDLVEFVVDAFDKHLAGKEGDRRVWDYSRALLALADEMESLGARSPKILKVRQELRSWV